MSQWVLVDCMDPLDEGEANPRLPLQSENDLREQLVRFSQRKPGLVHLDSPNKETLVIAIGGPFAGLAWYPPESERRFRGSRTALADNLVCSHPVDFSGEGIPTSLEPRELFPVEMVIDAVMHFRKFQRLPESMTWRAWNPVTLSWDVEPARNPAPPAPTLAAAAK